MTDHKDKRINTGTKKKNRKNSKPAERVNKGTRSKEQAASRSVSRKRQKLLYDFICSKNYEPMRAKEIAFLLDIPKAKRKEFLQALAVLEAKSMIEVTEHGLYRKCRMKAAGDASEDGRDENAIGSAEDPAIGGENGSLFVKADRKRDRRRGDRSETGAGRRTGRRADDSIGRGKRSKKPYLRSDEPGADLTELVEVYGIPHEFPDKVQRQADKCPNGPAGNDFAGRVDLRDKVVITIDGDDSKDLDDAVSVEKSGSNYILGVHIADVSNYVPASSAMDNEALRRGTSVYLPDRVIPMLPEKLSNGVCSLNEGQDRLTLSCFMKIDREGHTLESRIVESVICSSHRMTYTEVQKIIVDRDPELTSMYADIVPMLFDMKNLAEILREMRSKRGMIDFDIPETKIELDEEGRPVRIYPRTANTATRLIEQFMLSANETVAKRYADAKLPFLYRTHENPDEEKIENLLTTLRTMGVNVTKKEQHISSKEVQQIVAKVEGNPKEKMISSMLLRSMQQARYSPENCGHFGLAAKYYCHFTSPIRRYPDLQIHRIIKDDLRGMLGERKRSFYERILEDVAWKTSALERRATEIERECNKLKMAQYVAEHLGEVTEAFVTGVTEWGIYVQRPDTIEGLIHISSLKGDYYEYKEESMQLVGKNTGIVYELGQTLTVRTIRADTYRRIIDFSLVTESSESGEPNDEV
uniref:ribonuclease R n=1 Tax=Eubacterium cellulosolvens TaxID=29322 RepID=UPI00068500D5|nr:ribonuclease R [[Eubacterium] cellulosolvens]